MSPATESEWATPALASCVEENIQEREADFSLSQVLAVGDWVTSGESRGTSEHASSWGCGGKAASCKGWRLASKRDLNPVREVIKQEMEVEKERDP